MYRGPDGKGTEDSITGYLASGVPGTVAGLEYASKKYGRKPWAELVEEKVWRLCGSRFVGEVLRPGIGPDLKAPVAAHAAGVGELERGASEEGFAGETRGDRFWGFNEPLGIRVGGQERSHRLRPTSPEGGSGPQKFEELLPVADRETVKGMGDNICV